MLNIFFGSSGGKLGQSRIVHSWGWSSVDGVSQLNFFASIYLVHWRQVHIINADLSENSILKFIKPIDSLLNVHIQTRVSCSKSPAGLLPCCHQADIRMGPHRLLRLDDNESAASCQLAWCKLIVKTFYPQVWFKSFQQLAASLIFIALMQLDEANRLDATW